MRTKLCYLCQEPIGQAQQRLGGILKRPALYILEHGTELPLVIRLLLLERGVVVVVILRYRYVNAGERLLIHNADVGHIATVG